MLNGTIYLALGMNVCIGLYWINKQCFCVKCVQHDLSAMFKLKNYKL